MAHQEGQRPGQSLRRRHQPHHAPRRGRPSARRRCRRRHAAPDVRRRRRGLAQLTGHRSADHLNQSIDRGAAVQAFRAEPAVMTTSVARPRMPTILPSFTAMSQPHSVAAQQTGILHPPVHIVLGQPGLEVFVHSGGATPSSHGEFAVSRCRQCGQSWRPLVVIGLGMAHRMQPCAWAVRHCRLIRPTMPRM
jgi:hypothetical protein